VHACDPSKRSRAAFEHLAALVALSAAVGCLFVASGERASADAAPNEGRHYVVVFGESVGPWRITMRYRRLVSLIRTERRPERAGPGCVAGAAFAPWIDYYPGIRLAWYDGADRQFRLAEAATTRPGDRTTTGLIIGRTTLSVARRWYPQARLNRRPQQDYALGTSVLSTYRRTGYEAGDYLDLWFDVRGRLVALVTGKGGC
jgi:hypothetical protein